MGWDNTSPEDIHPSTVNRVSNSPPIIERLNEMRRNDSLRGSQKATAFSELKEVTRSTLTEVRALLNGDEDFDIKTYLESTASESKALQKLQGQVPDGLEDLRGQVISPKELSNQFNIIQKQSGIDIEAAVEHTLHLLEDNESYFLSQYDSEPRRLNSDQQENQQERTKLNFNPHVGTSPNIHNIIRQAHSEGRKHMRHAHKQKSNVKTSDRRRHLEESGTCPVPCTLDDTVCNCKKLHACASEISLYDLSAMYLNGYIEDDGNVTTQLNLFDANLPQKMADIDEILSAWDDSRDIRDDSQQQQENTRTLLGLGSQECMDCTGLNSNCVGTTISDTHCTPCSTGQSWWPCNIANECYCKKLTGRPTNRPTDKPTVYSSGMPTVERPSSSPMPTIDPKNLIMRPCSSSSGSGGSGNIDGGDGGGGKYSYNEQIISRYEISRSKLHPSMLEGMYVMDAHLAANKIVLVRELLMSPGIGGGGGDRGYSYTGFRSSLHTMITSKYKFVCLFSLWFNREWHNNKNLTNTHISSLHFSLLII